VKECYPSTYTPVINSSATFENGMFHAPNLQTVTFSTFQVAPLRSGGTTTYAWEFDTSPSSSRSFTPSNSPAAIGNTTFVTKAPNYSADIYNLTLQVVADGYCAFTPVSRPVIVDASMGALTGTVEISEVVAPTSDPIKPVLWIAKDRPVTLHAHYSPGSGETQEELNALTFRWWWVNGANSTFLGENDGTLKNYVPTTEVTDQRILVEVIDLNGKAATSKTYPYYVQNCGGNIPGLHININYPCDTDGSRVSAYVIDSIGNNYIYRVTRIGNKWWLTENLRANKQNNAYTTYIDAYGAYYHSDLVTELRQTDGRYCPKGWRIPTQDEWNNLNDAISPTNGELVFKGLATAETKPSTSVGDKAWNSTYVSNLPGSNSVGFNLVPAGVYYSGNVNMSGMRALFFTYEGSDVQVYGNLYGPGTTSTLGKDPNWWYTARCVND
jgi:uncharacterized protein (TIGR02145 family)